MKDLGEALEWYGETVKQLRLWRRIVAKYWSSLPLGRSAMVNSFRKECFVQRTVYASDRATLS